MSVKLAILSQTEKTLVRELESCHVYKKKFEVSERCSADQAGARACAQTRQAHGHVRSIYARPSAPRATPRSARAGRASQTTKAAVDDVSAEYARNQVARDTPPMDGRCLPLRPRGRSSAASARRL